MANKGRASPGVYGEAAGLRTAGAEMERERARGRGEIFGAARLRKDGAEKKRERARESV